jgi:hypothetical protein
VPELNPVRAVSSLFPSESGPRRSYALATLVNTFGTGLTLVSMPLYFTRIVDLSAGQVGLGLTIAVAISLAANLPIGEIADRRGPLQLAKIMLLVQSAAAFAFLFIGNFAGFLAVATVSTLAVRSIGTAEGALLRRVAGEDSAGFRSSTHAITNVGFTLGIACCGIAIHLDTPAAYRTLIVIDALSFVVAWAILRRLPRYDPLPRPATAPRWGVLRDRAYVAYAAISASFVLEFSVLTLLLPLWVAEHTNAPRWSIPLSVVINTILVVLFQVRLGGGVQTIRQGGDGWRRAGVLFLLSCSLLGFAAGLPGWAALIIVVAAVGLHTFGEIYHLSSGFALGMGLPPSHAQGQYDGFSAVLGGMASAAAPVLLLGVVLSLGRPGLIGLGVFFVLTSLLMPVVARWGERTRPDAAADVAGAQPVTAAE